LYCKNCSRILEPRNELWLRVEELQTQLDKNALSLVRTTGILPYIVNQLLVKPRERKLREVISSQGTRMSDLPNLEALVPECAYAISLEKLPSVYAITMAGAPNAFTFGSDDAPVIVVDRRLMDVMSTSDLRALLGHEMGHIKSGHMLYHSLAQTLAQGVEVSASVMGLNVISTPMHLALLGWQRESELSADRAALVSCGNPADVVSMFAKLTGAPRFSVTDRSSLLDNVDNLFRTHPRMSERARAVFEFANTGEYADITKKNNYRRMFRLAFQPVCRFCGSAKLIGAAFCQVCGKSQI